MESYLKNNVFYVYILSELSMFSSNRFSFRFHIEVYGSFEVCTNNKYGSNFILFHVAIPFSQYHVLKMLYFFLCVLSALSNIYINSYALQVASHLS